MPQAWETQPWLMNAGHHKTIIGGYVFLHISCSLYIHCTCTWCYRRCTCYIYIYMYMYVLSYIHVHVHATYYIIYIYMYMYVLSYIHVHVRTIFTCTCSWMIFYIIQLTTAKLSTLCTTSDALGTPHIEIFNMPDTRVGGSILSTLLCSYELWPHPDHVLCKVCAINSIFIIHVVFY